MIPKFLSHEPTKIILVGLNYLDHAKELSLAVPESPILFIKPVTSLIGPGEPIIYPEQSKRVDYEAELAVIIKNKIKDVSEVKGNILGYTCLNDVTARDLQKKDGQWTRAKSFDTFCPVGPRIVSDIDPDNVDVICRLNSRVVQHSNTRNLIFNVHYLVSFISKVMTLNPGDIISTGTPPGVGPMKRGDTVEVEIQGIGVLKNYVR